MSSPLSPLTFLSFSGYHYLNKAEMPKNRKKKNKANFFNLLECPSTVFLPEVVSKMTASIMETLPGQHNTFCPEPYRIWKKGNEGNTHHHLPEHKCTHTNTISFPPLSSRSSCCKRGKSKHVRPAIDCQWAYVRPHLFPIFRLWKYFSLCSSLIN